MCIFHMYNVLCDDSHVRRLAEAGIWEYCRNCYTQHGYPTPCEVVTSIGSPIPTFCPNAECMRLVIEKHGWRCHICRNTVAPGRGRYSCPNSQCAHSVCRTCILDRR